MNFIEAKTIKDKSEETFILENRIYNIIIVPENDIDLENYINEYRLSKFNDESAIIFSKNSKYKVCGLWTDGVNVLKRNLI
jgi:hypothetical protein